jgi:hypothetical protein
VFLALRVVWRNAKDSRCIRPGVDRRQAAWVVPVALTVGAAESAAILAESDADIPRVAFVDKRRRKNRHIAKLAIKLMCVGRSDATRGGEMVAAKKAPAKKAPAKKTPVVKKAVAKKAPALKKATASKKAPAAKKATAKKAAAKRTLVEPTPGDKRYVRRDPAGQFKDVVDVGKSLSADKRTTAKKTVAVGPTHAKWAPGATHCGHLAERRSAYTKSAVVRSGPNQHRLS